jgi:hypothetical protein
MAISYLLGGKISAFIQETTETEYIGNGYFLNAGVAEVIEEPTGEVSLLHAFVNLIADEPAFAGTMPSHWNAEHVLHQDSGKLLGRSSSGRGITQQITVGDGLSLLNGELTASGSTANDFDTLASLTGESNGYDLYAVDDILRTRKEGFVYTVAASDASDHHLTTTSGMKLYVQPSPGYIMDFDAFNPAKDNVTDDYDTLATAIAACAAFDDGDGPALLIRDGLYYIGSTINLKHTIRIMGHSAGMPDDDRPNLRFPLDTAGIIINTANSNYGEFITPSTTSADGTIIEGIKLQGGCTSSIQGSDRDAHGIYSVARAVVRNCIIGGFSGDGIQFYASDTLGNANSWEVHTVRITNCQNGLKAFGSNANAGYAYNVDASLNRRWGITDDSFLGNTFVGCHTAFNGPFPSTGPTISNLASYGGADYQAVPGVDPALWLSTQPGTDADVWRLTADGLSVPWTGSEPADTYHEGGGYHSSNENARCLFMGCYSEGGQGLTWMSQHTLVIGGFLNVSPVQTGAQIETSFSGLYTESSYSVHYREPQGGLTNTTSLGGGSRTALLFQALSDEDSAAWRLQYHTASGAWIWCNGNLTAERVAMRFTSTDTDMKFGTSVVQPYIVHMPGFALGGDPYTSRRFTTGTAAPTNGARAQGDFVFNTATVAGGNLGWVCTSGGAIATDAWAPSTAYTVGALRTNDGGKTYVCDTAGTSAGSGGPTGTGTDFVDGTARWDYQAPFVYAEFGNSVLQNTATYDPPSLAAGVVDTIQSMTVTGAALGDIADVSFSLDLQGIDLRAWVSATNTVKYVFSCPAGGATVDLGSGTVKCRIRK